METLLYYYFLWLLIGTILYLIITNNKSCALCYYGFVTKYLYEKTEMNIFGCIVIALFYYILFLILFILRDIAMVIYWLFHIKRKNS